VSVPSCPRVPPLIISPISRSSTSAVQESGSSSPPSPERETQSTSTARRPRTPLFMSYDSPNASPLVNSLQLSPASDSSFTPPPPRLQARSPVLQSRPAAQASTSADLFDLFSSDSPPPPPRQVRSPSASSSTSDADRRVYVSESDNDSPMAGPSKSRKSTVTSQSSVRRRHSPSVSASPSPRPIEVSYSADVKPDLASLEVLGDVKPVINISATTPSSKPRRRAFLEFLDTVAQADSKSEDEYEYHLE
jgi:hypothetical protein